MKTRRLIALILSICLLLGCGIVANASSGRQAQNPSLYILSEPVPNEAVALAQQLFDAGAGYLVGELTSEIATVSLGTPFVMDNSQYGAAVLYYFPVFQSGQIIQTYRLFQDDEGEWGYIISYALVEELNNLIGKTSATNPAVLYADDNLDVVLQSASSIQTIEVDPTKDRQPITPRLYATELAAQKAASATTAARSLATPVDLAAPRDIPNPAPGASSRCIEIVTNNYVTLGTTIRETQSSLPWCAGYVTAHIVNYRTGATNWRASHVAAYAGVGPTQGISREKCRDFAISKGLSQTSIYNAVATDAQLKSQLYNRRPIYAGCYEKGSTTSSHAFAIIGYDVTLLFGMHWQVWNPWYNYKEWVYNDRTYFNLFGGNFNAWHVFIWNF
jgi:hypothetical protein